MVSLPNANVASGSLFPFLAQAVNSDSPPKTPPGRSRGTRLLVSRKNL